ncbi:MAG: hypothetical protein ACNS63_08485 [Candidatus Nitrospinota bacterium M3_3B_026]
MVEIVRAYTARENYKGRDAVIVDWFCRGRETPVAPYETLIGNYDELSYTERERAEELVDHFLTAEEAEQLRRYMDRKFGFEVKVKKMETPFADGRKIPRFAEPPEPSAEGEYLDLSASDDYDLSVPIMGYFDLSEPPNLVSHMS